MVRLLYNVSLSETPFYQYLMFLVLNQRKENIVLKKLFHDQISTKECAVREHVMQFQVNKYIHYQGCLIFRGGVSYESHMCKI